MAVTCGHGPLQRVNTNDATHTLPASRFAPATPDHLGDALRVEFAAFVSPGSNDLIGTREIVHGRFRRILFGGSDQELDERLELASANASGGGQLIKGMTQQIAQRST